MHHQDLVMKQHHQPGREFPRKHKGNIPYIHDVHIHYSQLTPSAFQLPITLSLWEETGEHKEIIPILLYNTGHVYTRQQK